MGIFRKNASFYVNIDKKDLKGAFNPTNHGGGDKTSPPIFLILNNSKTVIASHMKLSDFS